MGNAVVHFEVNGPQLDVLTKFYGDLFGWKIQSLPELTYATTDTASGGGINGGFGQTPDGSKFVTFYVAVADLEKTLAKVEHLGGKVAMPATEIPNVVTLAQFNDPEGNLIGLVKSDDDADQAPAVSAGENPAVNWFEILGKDAADLKEFYSELFGWKITPYSGEIPYFRVETGSESGIGGGLGSGPQGEPHVTVYAEVDEVKKWLDRAEKLGGKAVLGPMVVGENLVVGAFQDPQQTVFGVWATK